MLNKIVIRRSVLLAVMAIVCTSWATASEQTGVIEPVLIQRLKEAARNLQANSTEPLLAQNVKQVAHRNLGFWDDIGDAFESVGSTIVGGVGGVLASIGPVLGDIGGFFNDVGGFIESSLSVAGDFIADQAGLFAQLCTQAVGEVATQVSRAARAIEKGAIAAVGFIKNAIEALFGCFKKLLQGEICIDCINDQNKVADPLFEALEDAIAGIDDILPQNVLNLLGTLTSASGCPPENSIEIPMPSEMRTLLDAVDKIYDLPFFLEGRICVPEFDRLFSEDGFQEVLDILQNAAKNLASKLEGTIKDVVAHASDLSSVKVLCTGVAVEARYYGPIHVHAEVTACFSLGESTVQSFMETRIVPSLIKKPRKHPEAMVVIRSPNKVQAPEGFEAEGWYGVTYHFPIRKAPLGAAAMASLGLGAWASLSSDNLKGDISKLFGTNIGGETVCDLQMEIPLIFTKTQGKTAKPGSKTALVMQGAATMIKNMELSLGEIGFRWPLEESKPSKPMRENLKTLSDSLADVMIGDQEAHHANPFNSVPILLRTAAKGDECLDKHAGRDDVHFYPCHGKTNQLWRFDPKTRQLRNVRNNKCLRAVVDGDEHKAIVDTCRDNYRTQKWTMHSDGSIFNMYYERCLDGNNGGDAKVRPCNGGGHQRFAWYSAPVMLVPKTRRYGEHISCVRLVDGELRVSPGCDGSKWELFTLTSSGMVLQAEHNDCVDQPSWNKAVVHKCHGGENQRFAFRPDKTVRSLKDGKCLSRHDSDDTLRFKTCANLPPRTGQCLNGIPGADACCPLECGKCGGSGCGDRPGGASNCCIGQIRSAGVLCTESDAPCLITEPETKRAPSHLCDGLLQGDVCCPLECGTCGGSGCGGRPGGPSKCCIGEVRSAGRSCDSALAPCIMPTVPEQVYSHMSLLASQGFDMLPAPGPILNNDNEKCLKISWGKGLMVDCEDSDYQKFFVSIKGEIVTMKYNKCMEVDSSGSILFNRCDGSRNQSFDVSFETGKITHIDAANVKRCMYPLHNLPQFSTEACENTKSNWRF